jgi:FkbM family methyltransferase
MLRQSILGSPLGRAAAAGRDLLDRLRAGQDDIATILNDQLATRIVTRLCRPAMTFVDVGAHIGSVIAEVRVKCPTAKIVAVEAMPDKAERLVAKFKTVEVQCTALGETEGEAHFFVDRRRSGYSSLADNGGESIKVILKPLDQVLLLDDVDVMKIDVEGAELGVLIGGDALVRRCRPTIMFESGPEEVLGYTKAAMFDWFASRDYGIFVPMRLAHTAPPLDLGSFIDSHHYPRRTTNYFAVPLERIAEIRQRTATFI